ncbi:unnamed protein product [Orchesella dallaii]|uniref:Uncharacterized protein n=1 Tax=Orchesella dallaii TaxID=48710 RepID=A0ABP1RGP7_9HEXA
MRFISINPDILRQQEATVWVGTQQHDSTVRMTWENIFFTNFKIILKQRYCAPNLVLILDSVFKLMSGSNCDFNNQLIHQLGVDEFQRTRTPTAFLWPINVFNSTVEFWCSKRLTYPTFASAILIFANENSNSISIGSFVDGISKSLYDFQTNRWTMSISFRSVSTPFGSTFTSLIEFWKRIHSSFHFRAETSGSKPITYNGMSLTTMLRSQVNDEKLETFRAFFKWTNCSNYEGCLNFYSELLKVSDANKVSILREVFPFGQSQIWYMFQVLFPKTNYFDSNIAAFLKPFTGFVWLYTISTIAIISAFLIWKGNGSAGSMLFLHYSIVFEQDDGRQFQKSRPWVKVMISLWIFTAIALRNFYNSSLYSMMAAERIPDEYPKSIMEFLGRKDFDLLVPEKTCDVFWRILHNFKFMIVTNTGSRVAPHLDSFYSRMLLKFSCSSSKTYIEALQNASNGNVANTYVFDSTKRTKNYAWLGIGSAPHFINPFKKDLVNLGLCVSGTVKVFGMLRF